MARVGDRHVCDGTKAHSTTIRVMLKKNTLPLKGEWRMVEYRKCDEDDWMMFDCCGQIHYCPWCGIKLEAVG